MRTLFLCSMSVACVVPSAPPSAVSSSPATRAVEPVAVWQVDGTDGERLGLEVAGLGDVNGDGWLDWAVATEEAGGNSAGRIDVYYGSAAGWPASPAVLLEGRSGYDYLGGSVAGGDVNGDGFADLIAGYYPDNGGGASVFPGGSGGLEETPSMTMSSSSWTDYLGEWVLSELDFDADGVQDMVISNRSDASVIVMMGAPTLPGPTQVVQPGGDFGSALAGGDFDGDGYDDLAVGNSYLWDQWLTTPAEPERVAVFLGGPAGLAPTPAVAIESPAPEPEWFASQRAVAAGDLNGDGYDDLAIGAPRADEERGRLQVHLGSPTGLDPAAVLELQGDQIDGQLGRVVAIDDLDGDGFDDLILGLPHYDWYHGQVRIHAGGPAGPSATPTMVMPGLPGSSFGWSLGTPGDLDGDGLAELLVGAPDLNIGDGRAFLFAGAAQPPPPDTGDTGLPTTDTGTSGTTTPPEDTAPAGDTGDTGAPVDDPDGDDADAEAPSGCGCASSGAPTGALWAAPLLALLALRRRGSWVLALSLAACTPSETTPTDTDPGPTDTDTDTTDPHTGDTGSTDPHTGDTGTPGFVYDWTGVDTQARFDGWVAWLEEQLVEQELPGLQVAVAIDGQVVHTASLGVRDIRTSEPVTDDTRFGFGSVSKMFLATVAQDLVEEGQLDLDAPVTDYLPGLVLAPTFDPSTLTTRMALTHTTGLPDVWNGANPPADVGCTSWESYDALWEGRQYPLITVPGVAYNYSNTGYTLAAHVITEITGGPLEEAVRERISDPLGLSVTYDLDEVIGGSFAAGHSPEADPADQAWTPVPEDWECRGGMAAGGLFGTASDVATLLATHGSGQGTLESDSFTEMQRQVSMHCPETLEYGLGLYSYTHTSPTTGLTWVAHGGYVPGYQANAVYIPEARLTVVALTNHDLAEQPPAALTTEGVYQMLDIVRPEPLDLTTPPSTWSAYEGSYLAVDGNDLPLVSGAPYEWSWDQLTFQLVDDTLFGSFDGRDPQPATQLYEECWSHPDFDLPIYFLEGPDGVADRVVYRGGTYLTEDEVPVFFAPSAPAPAAPPEPGVWTREVHLPGPLRHVLTSGR